MRPDAIAADVGYAAIEDFEIRSAFLQQNAPGCVIALAQIEAAAVGDLYIVNPDRVAGIDQNREAGDPGGLDLRDFKIGDAFGQYSAVGRKAREHGFGRRQAERPRDGVAVAVERKVVNS